MKGKDYERSFGVDLDMKNPKRVKFFVKRMMFVGMIVEKYPTRKGWHFRVRTNKKITWLHYISLREYCGDDTRRIVRDIIRMKQGLSYDHLFHSKMKGWKWLKENIVDSSLIGSEF